MEKVVIDKMTKEVVGKIFKICKGCGRVFGQNQDGACPDCGGKLEEKGIINSVENPNQIFVARNPNK
ncbi:MAG: hypothetical protein PHW43_03685 [Syntrophales bacterium]|nr:hypothetical protein [Syntrophales bacterium]